MKILIATMIILVLMANGLLALSRSRLEIKQSVAYSRNMQVFFKSEACINCTSPMLADWDQAGDEISFSLQGICSAHCIKLPDVETGIESLSAIKCQSGQITGWYLPVAPLPLLPGEPEPEIPQPIATYHQYAWSNL